ncbi:MAG: hypothetical protein HQ483_18115 [Rhodospirillales bacterium]|nr:hypothetical protein [Rhodospirillales bacterium]
MTEPQLSLVTPADHLDYKLIEFVHKYADGQRVHKRGLDATPMVVQKYAIREKEVMAFSNHERRKCALTAFHFHPDFPDNQRRTYMEAHQDGYELAQEVEAQRRAELRHDKSRWTSRLAHTGRTVAVLLHTMIIYSVTHHSDS